MSLAALSLGLSILSLVGSVAVVVQIHRARRRDNPTARSTPQ